MRIVILLFLLVLSPLIALAQQGRAQLSQAPAPDWVLPLTADWQTFALGRDEASEYLLVDRQSRVSENEHTAYSRYARRLNTSDALEDNADITVDFNPRFQNVVFHRVAVIRDGKELDQLDLDLIELYRVENDRDRLIYNRALQAAVVLQGLKVGDILDYAYSVEGQDPVLGSHFAFYVQHQYGVPVRYNRDSVLVPTGRHVTHQTRLDAPALAISEADGFTRYFWEAEDIPAKRVEDDMPFGHHAYAMNVLTSFADWAEVGAHFAPDYTAPVISDEIKAIARDIAASSADKKKQIRAALGYVQREIRYLGVDIGQGGFVPRPVDQILQSRFGDCKDMVMLLTTLLRELGVEAAPLFVDSKYRGKIDTIPPSHSAFDHVVALVTFDGTQYVLDPTRGEQLGALDHLQQGNFQKGVVVSPDGPGMIDVQLRHPPYYLDVHDTYSIKRASDRVKFISTITFYKASADNFARWMRNDGVREIEKEYLDYYQNIFDEIEMTAPLNVRILKDEGRVQVTATFEITEPWNDEEYTNGGRGLQVYPYDLLDYLPDYEGGSRQAPFAIKDPVRVRHRISFAADVDLQVSRFSTNHDHPALTFSVNTSHHGALVTRTFYYGTKSDRIAPEDFKATMKTIRAASRTRGLYAEHALDWSQKLENWMETLPAK